MSNEKNMRTENLRLALVKAYADALAEFLKNAREDHLDLLMEKYQEEGNKSFNVLLPDGGKVGTITMNQGKASDEITDEAALYEWAAPKGGTKTERVPEVPAVPAKDVTRLDKRWFDDLTKHAIEGDDGQLIDSHTGEVIPGLRRTPVPDPHSFTVRYEKNGRERIAKAYQRGQLNDLISGTALPAIETTTTEGKAA